MIQNTKRIFFMKQKMGVTADLIFKLNNLNPKYRTYCCHSNAFFVTL
jgi:hypothetical protein